MRYREVMGMLAGFCAVNVLAFPSGGILLSGLSPEDQGTRDDAKAVMQVHEDFASCVGAADMAEKDSIAAGENPSAVYPVTAVTKRICQIEKTKRENAITHRHSKREHIESLNAAAATKWVEAEHRRCMTQADVNRRELRQTGFRLADQVADIDRRICDVEKKWMMGAITAMQKGIRRSFHQDDDKVHGV